MGAILMDKQQLRIWAKEERKKLDIKALSDQLVKKLQDTEEYKQAKNVMLFYPKKDEINLLSIIEDETKKFYSLIIKNLFNKPDDYQGFECLKAIKASMVVTYIFAYLGLSIQAINITSNALIGIEE